MFDSILKFFKKLGKENKKDSKDTAKERLHLVLMQDRANVSADFMELMKQEIIEVIKKYIDVDENSIDVKLTNKVNSDGTTGAPILYANIPILNVKDDTKQIHIERKLPKDQEQEKEKVVEEKKEPIQNIEEVKEETTEVKEQEESQKQITENEKQEDLPSETKQEEKQQVSNNEKEAIEEKVQEVDQKQENSAQKTEKNEEQKQEEDKNSNHVEV